MSLLSCLPDSNLKIMSWGNVFVNSLWPVNTATSLNYVNIGVGSGLVPDGARPLPESLLMYHHQLGTYHQSA